MTSTTSGHEGERKAYSAKIQAKVHSSESCSFCWFVVAVYPTLKGMTPRDDEVYREHLKKAHGLTGEIAP